MLCLNELLLNLFCCVFYVNLYIIINLNLESKNNPFYTLKMMLSVTNNEHLKMKGT